MTATGLRRFLEPQKPDVARCEMCAEPTGTEHGHVVNAREPGAPVHVPELLPAVHP